MELGPREGGGNQDHFEPAIAKRRDGERDPIHRDGSLLGDLGSQVSRETQAHDTKSRFSSHSDHGGHRVDVAEHEMSAEPVAWA